MLQINDLEVIKDKRVLLRVEEMNLEESSINALYGSEKSGKSLLTRAIHGTYHDYRGIVDFHNSNKDSRNSYLISQAVLLLQTKSVHDNLSYKANTQEELIREYSLLAGLENDLELMVRDLTFEKHKMVELAIACGLNPKLLLIDDFDKCFTNQNLVLAGKLLSKYKIYGGIVLLTSKLRIPEADSAYEIQNYRVVKI